MTSENLFRRISCCTFEGSVFERISGDKVLENIKFNYINISFLQKSLYAFEVCSYRDSKKGTVFAYIFKFLLQFYFCVDSKMFLKVFSTLSVSFSYVLSSSCNITLWKTISDKNGYGHYKRVVLLELSIILHRWI